jgi:hypothetical protein
MSERMIPLKIADMAVAACNEEIAKLLAENARLHSQFANSEQKVARLIKAGTAMGMCLPDTDEANAAYRAFEYAAKGVQS